MPNVKFDNFRWSSNADPHWDEWHLNVEIPVTNPSTGQNYITKNQPRFVMQPPFDEQTYLEYEQLRLDDPDAYTALPFGIDSMTFKLYFDYTDSGGNPQTWEMPKLIDMTEYTLGHWILARYQKISVLHPELDPHALHVDYFDYKVGSNLDPILEALLEEAFEGEEFLPVVLLMQDKIWYDWPHGVEWDEGGFIPQYPEDYETDLHRTTNRMLKKLAIKGAEVKEKFLEQEADESNTDNQAEKWDFLLHFGAPIYTAVNETAVYLFHFFERIAATNQYIFDDYQAYLGSTNPYWPYYWSIPVPGSFAPEKKYYKAAPPITSMNITEGTVTGYDVTFGWSYIFQRSFQGQFHDDRDAGYLNQGHEEPLLPGQASIQMYERQKRNTNLYRHGLDLMHEDPDIIIGSHEEGYHDYVIFTLQHGDFDEEGTPINMHYDRILVMGLSMEYRINVTEGDFGNYIFRNADIGLFDVDESYQPTHAFRIPLSVQGLKDMPLLKREAVIADSLTYTVFLVHKQKVKWYESGFWKIFIVIVAVILIVVVAIYGLGNIAAGIATAVFGAAAATSPLLVFVLTVVLAFAIGQIIAMAGQSIGGLWGTVFVVIASIVMANAAAGTGGFQMSGSWGNAVNYINMVGPYLDGAMQIYSYYVTDQLQQEWEMFLMNAREKQRLLDEAWQELDTHSWLSSWDIMQSRSFQTEDPGQYLARTKTTNPGRVANDLVYNFARIALSLPEYPMEKNPLQEMFEGFQRQSGRITGVA
jgi:hypothetical protein